MVVGWRPPGRISTDQDWAQHKKIKSVGIVLTYLLSFQVFPFNSPSCVFVLRRLRVYWGPRVHSPAADDPVSVMGQPRPGMDYGQVSPPTIPDACPAQICEKSLKYQTSDPSHRNWPERLGALSRN